jgi:murein endopeptidase
MMARFGLVATLALSGALATSCTRSRGTPRPKEPPTVGSIKAVATSVEDPVARTANRDDEERHDDGDEDGDEALGDALDDGFDLPNLEGDERPHPFAHLSDAELHARLREDPTSLGSLSIGRPSGGRLIGGVQMPEGPHWRLVSPDGAFGTEETVAFLKTTIEAVAKHFPGTKPLPIGHISGKAGGPLAPHISHQNGRDVDLGFYYLDDSPWYRRATAKNFDVARNWALVRGFVTMTDVELILIDHRLQGLLRAHAEALGEDRAWLDDVFRGKAGRPPLVRHAPGHGTHLHVRFFNPTAQETARRCLDALVELGLVEPPTYFVHHRVRKGETLGKLAKRYGTTVRAIQRANGLRSTLIQAKKTYRIPRTGPAPRERGPIRVPRRRLPPREGAESPTL